MLTLFNKPSAIEPRMVPAKVEPFPRSLHKGDSFLLHFPSIFPRHPEFRFIQVLLYSRKTARRHTGTGGKNVSALEGVGTAARRRNARERCLGKNREKKWATACFPERVLCVPARPDFPFAFHGIVPGSFVCIYHATKVYLRVSLTET